jgi:hypothetical protein
VVVVGGLTLVVRAVLLALVALLPTLNVNLLFIDMSTLLNIGEDEP